MGDSYYFLTNQGRIFVSNDKGYNWSVIDTPLTDGQNISFDFKDSDNGLCSYSKPYPNENIYELYSTTDGGQNWTQITTTTKVSSLKYLPNQNI